MTAELTTLEVRSRRQWRVWLATHHTSTSGIWLVFYKHHTGLKSMPYEDAVREALCFGWVDSLIKRLDEDRYAVKVTVVDNVRNQRTISTAPFTVTAESSKKS